MPGLPEISEKAEAYNPIPVFPAGQLISKTFHMVLSLGDYWSRSFF
jgi:hypothetical protein